MRPDIPFSAYQDRVERDIYIVIEPIALKIEEGDIDDAREMLGRLTLWLLDKVEAGELESYKARNAYFILNVYLTDNFMTEIMGDDAHELIYEGTLLHEVGQDMGPDIGFMRGIAERLAKGEG